MNNMVIHENSKYNKLNYKGYCCMCLEHALFRHVLLNGINQIMCTRCLASKPLRAGIKGEVLYMYNETLSTKNEFIRAYTRLKAFFTGTWNRKRFSYRILIGK